MNFSLVFHCLPNRQRYETLANSAVLYCFPWFLNVDALNVTEQGLCSGLFLLRDVTPSTAERIPSQGPRILLSPQAVILPVYTSKFYVATFICYIKTNTPAFQKINVFATQKLPNFLVYMGK
jgi:hypothetical protein